MRLFYQPLVPEGVRYLDEEESRHCVKVLRLKNQDTIYVTDGKGAGYACAIEKADIRRCTFKIIHSYASPLPDYTIHIVVAPTKNQDRMEWLVEKAVELGVTKISFIVCDLSERNNVKMERIEKKAIMAMKQSLKYMLPALIPPINFKEFLSSSTATEKYIAYVDSELNNHLFRSATPGQDYLILIGPEGDFSTEEIKLARELNYIPVSLGQNRLRTETAALAACHCFHLINA